MAASDAPVPVHDPRVLRAIAHPVRNRVLGELEAAGPLRAADLAQLLGIPANQASFHLRQLAKYGLVEPAPELARDKRDRVWRLVAPAGLRVDLAELKKAPGGAAAVSVFRRSSGDWARAVVESAFAETREPGATYAVTDQSLRLTGEEAHELVRELDAVLRRWAGRSRDGDDGQRRTYLVLQVVQPYPELEGRR
ncbi:MAG TPA: helix-turn-helix domain-containing protein [Nocardioides sp.]|uniref:helix-turn-helix domain-containing protein n=1 Tax=Nocardioides sp. TaxID=35761 RepID=UPI002B88537A|nr:helix-turn-helix domain-containing protein [Nocardioides sp.]HQR25868.1 helix-turn-helix domain-containing protein [Nocardioides sp.]